MKKKLIFCISLVLVAVICMTSMPFSAFSFDTNVNITSVALLLVNTETGTVVYEKNADKVRYASYLSHIMTFIVAYNNVSDLDKEQVEINDALLQKISNTTDNSLTKYVGKNLTIRDLMYFILLDNSVDAAYILADYVSQGNIDEFVKLMNDKAVSLGCTKTKFSSPSMVANNTQYTTCRDMYKILKSALDIEAYREISGKLKYLPSPVKKEKHTIYNKNSLLKSDSPYYFKYTQNGKYAADRVARGNLVTTAVYRNVTYACIILGAQITGEHNAFTEAKQMFTWAYTHLGNKQIISGSEVLGKAKSENLWDDTYIEFTAGEDIYRTMPGDFEQSKLDFIFEIPDKVKLPVFQGQNLGTAKIYYDGELFDEVNLVADKSDGISMIDDIGSFLSSMYKKTIPDLSDDTEGNAKSISDESEAQKPVISDMTAIKGAGD